MSKGDALQQRVSQVVISLGLFAGTLQMPIVVYAAGALNFSLDASQSRVEMAQTEVLQTRAIAKTEAVDFQSVPLTQQHQARPRPPKVESTSSGQKASVSLSFSPPKASQRLVTDPATWTKPFTFFSRSIFKGGAESLVARTVGHAEGTRTVTGEPTWAYWGHVDPGNQVWNRGTFSYQHSASSPEDADVKQLKRLKRQTKELERQAKAKGFKLSLLEKLNGIDLANQAPLAALDRGYIDWLAEAKQIDLPEEEAILWARTWAYWDPDLNTWNAPGLGNTRSSIEADQRRRQWAIAQVLHQCPRDNPTDCPAR